MSHQWSREVLARHLEQAEQETHCLAEISQALNRTFNLPELLNDICQRVCDLLAYRACSVMLADPDEPVLTIHGYAGMNPEYVAQLNSQRAIKLMDRALSGGPSGQAYLRGTAVAIHNIYQQQQFQPWVTANPGFSAMIALPLGFRGRRIGVLNCYSTKPHEYSDRERSLLTTIAAQAAVAIGIVQLQQAQEEQLRRQQAQADQLKEQRDQLLQSRRIHDRLTGIVLTGGDTHALTRALADLVQTPVGVVDSEANLISAYGPGGEEWPSVWNGESLVKAWRLTLVDEGPPDLRPVRLPPEPAAGIPFGRVVAPIMAGEERLGYLAAVEGLRSLSSLDLAAVEHAATAIALDLVHAQTLMEAEQHFRGDFFEELVRGSSSDAYVRNRFEQLGLKPEASYQVLLVAVSGVQESGPGLGGDRVRRRLLGLVQDVVGVRSRLALTVYRGGRFAVLWPAEVPGQERGTAPPAPSLAQAIQQSLTGVFPDREVSIGVGRPYAELSKLKRSYEEADSALRVLERLGARSQVLSFTDLGLYRVLLQSASSEELLKFSRDTLQPIREHDAQYSSGLELTLRTYLECHLNTLKTAETLFVHPNTVSYRLHKLDQVCGVELKNPEHLLAFQLALMIDRMVPRSGH